MLGDDSTDAQTETASIAASQAVIETVDVAVSSTKTSYQNFRSKTSY